MTPKKSVTPRATKAKAIKAFVPVSGQKPRKPLSPRQPAPCGFCRGVRKLLGMR